jgi:acetyltransferase-like isoleucine patch superfamily enzyme
MLRVVFSAGITLILTALGANAQPAGQVVRSVKSGVWSSPKTWDSGQLPSAGSRVLIRAGHTVRYDVDSADVIRVVHVAGTLTFARDRDTRLDAGLIRIQTGNAPSEEGFDCEGHLDIDESAPRPALEIGTPNQPIESKFSALVRLHYLKGMDPQSCPAIVCCGGRMDIHGSPMPRTWLPLGDSADRTGTSVTLSEAAPHWKAGDRVIITATRGNHGDARETEERVIKKIDGNKLTLDRPLVFNHVADDDFRGIVGNLSRNVVIESAQPNGVRGHTMYHRNSLGAISYAEFRHLGKRDVLGRYPIHYHLVGNTMRGSYVIGASIWDSHNRWATVHGTNFLIVRDCVGYKSIGNGFYLEDGTEILNVFDRNLAVRSLAGRKLPKQALPFDDNEGAGFWWANSLNTFTNNVTCENDKYGYRFEATETPAMRMTQPVLLPDGKRRLVDLRCLPFVRFDNNEAHADGRYGFNLGEGVVGIGPNSSFPFTIRNMKIWETHYAFRPQSPAVLVENMTIKNCEYGIYHPHYERHVYRNLHLIGASDEPFNRGHDDDSIQFGSVTVDGLTFENVGLDGIALIQISDTNATGRAETHIRNLKVINSGARTKRATVDLGGSAKPEPKSAFCVPVYLHDFFGAGRTAKIVSIKSDHLRRDKLTYRALPFLTGDESRVAEVRDVAFPKLLDPVDDFPPATVITHLIPTGKDGLIVRGTSADNGAIAKVIVNEQLAKATRPNFAEWEVTLAGVKDGAAIRAHAVDAAGNVEVTPHEVAYRK